jgi:hypothetical protein
MQLLVDTDIFCKLGISGLLDEALAVLGSSAPECSRLPALPRMLQRGGIVRRYGASACSALIPQATVMAVIGAPSDEWLEPLVGVPSIDVGEAQLLALAAQHSLVLLSGDKRALRAVANLDVIVFALQGKVVTFEAILISLCLRLGPENVRTALKPLAAIDPTVKICFSPGNYDPVSALTSYLSALEAEVAPLLLWKPLV